MANEVTIDVEARFQDNITPGARRAANTLDQMRRQMEQTGRLMDGMGRRQAQPTVTVRNEQATRRIRETERMLGRLSGRTTTTTVRARDLASAVIYRLMRLGSSFANRVWTAALRFRDSAALSTIRRVTSAAESMTKRTWTAAIRIKDFATAPLNNIRNTLFSIQTLVAAVTAGIATHQLVLKPISLADQYSSAQIGFSTLLGETRGQKMMDDLDTFAKATPFNASQVIQQTQRMLAMSWDPENIIEDMRTIGDAAAATGKGEQGLQQIVTALAQIKTKGKLSTEELNQLAEAGLSAKRYIAEGLGYGSGDEGIAAMTKDLENGAIASGKALDALLAGMQEYKGMMDATANETAGGLWSQIQDAFEIDVFRKWGQGLQEGAKQGLGTVVTLLDQVEGALDGLGSTLFDIGAKASDWFANQLSGAVDRIFQVTDSYEFRTASMLDKIKLLWKGVVSDPFSEWMNNDETAAKAEQMGRTIGEALKGGIMALLGITDVFSDAGLDGQGGANVAQSFAKGFVDGFDVSAITGKIAEAIGNVWDAMPLWAKVLVGAYAGGKAASFMGSAISGISSMAAGARGLIGAGRTVDAAGNIVAGSGLRGFVGGVSARNLAGTTVAGSGLLVTLEGVGAGLSGGAMAGGTAALAGGAAIAGGAMAGASVIHGGAEFYRSYKAYQQGDRIEGDARAASGSATMAGAAVGATIGLIGGPIGALIGAGIGGVAGWIGGGKWADSIRETKYETEGLVDALKNASSEEERQSILNKAAYEAMRDRMGDVRLTAEEISRLTDQIVWGDKLEGFNQFAAATKNAENSLKSMESSSQKLDKWMWKAGLGVTFNQDERDSIVESANEYLESAKSYLENKHYEFQTSASLLLDLESDTGKGIVDAGNAYFAAEQEKLNAAGKELGDAFVSALADGIISADEEEAILAAQRKIDEITTKLNQAEAEANLEMLKIKWGGGNLDLDSFDNFMASLQSEISAQTQTLDDALTVQIKNLKLMYPEGGEAYDEAFRALLDGYTVQVDSVNAEVRKVALGILGDAFEGDLGADAVAALDRILQYSIDNNLSPIEIPTDKLFELAGVSESSMGEEVQTALRQMLDGVYNSLNFIDTENIGVEIGVEPEVTVNPANTAGVAEALKGSVPDTLHETVTMMLDGDAQITKKVDVAPKDFGVPKSQNSRVIEKITGVKSIQNTLSVTGADFGLKSTIRHTVTVQVSAVKQNLTNLMNGQAFRGGIFGAGGNNAFARGGIAGYSDGGYVSGGAQLITVAEEGTPEMIIPLSTQRRDRALKLWEEAGHIMGVSGFALGGLTEEPVIRGGGDEGIRFIGRDVEAGDRSVRVDVGGVQVSIQVDASGTSNIAEAIQAQSGEIAETVAGILADAFSDQFQNTPTKGGVA